MSSFKKMVGIRIPERIPKNRITYVERLHQQQPQCSFGISGGCCKICAAGPCRFGGKFTKGVCGASFDVISARNFLRSVAASTAAHADHARLIADALKTHAIKDPKALGRLLKRYRAKDKKRLSEKLFGEFAFYDFKISRALHQTTFGVNADPHSYLETVLDLGKIDYKVMSIASDLQDVMFGTPHLVKCEANLGVLKQNYVNIVVHGHIPLLAEKIIEHSKKMSPDTKKAHAMGINIVGMCCDAHELAHHGVPMAGHLLQQEFAIMTGAVDAMVVDLQCIFPSLKDLAECYHTKLITTYDIGKIHGAMHIPFSNNPDESAKKIIKEAIAAYRQRHNLRVNIPKNKSELYAGFSLEEIDKKVGIDRLAKALKKGDILGIVAIVGCRNPKIDKMHEKLARSLIKKNILVLSTGCSSHALAQTGLMVPNRIVGKKMRRFLSNHHKLPPCWHMGACVDNSKVFRFFEVLAKKMKIKVSKLPVVFCTPEWVTEKALAIGSASLANGLATYVNPRLPLSKRIIKFLKKDLRKINGGFLITAKSPMMASMKIVRVIKKKKKMM